MTSLGRLWVIKVIFLCRATREALDELAARVEEQSRQLEHQNGQMEALQVHGLPACR